MKKSYALFGAWLWVSLAGAFAMHAEPGVYMPTPGTGPSALVTSNVTATSVDLSWTAGSGGTAYIVVAREGFAPAFDPTDGTDYTSIASTDYSLGTSQPGGGRIVYVGAATSTTVTGLSGYRPYFFEVFIFDGADFAYNTVATATGSATTAGFNPVTIAAWDFALSADSIADVTNANNVGTFINGAAVTVSYGTGQYRASAWNAGDFIQFNLNTLGAYSLSLDFRAFRNATGPPTITIQYSTDGGVNFFTAQTITLGTTAADYTDLYFPPVVSNRGSVLFRIRGDGTGGQVRFENITFESKPIYYRTNAGAGTSFVSAANWDFDSDPAFSNPRPATLDIPQNCEWYASLNRNLNISGILNYGQTTNPAIGNLNVADGVTLGLPGFFTEQLTINSSVTTNQTGRLGASFNFGIVTIAAGSTFRTGNTAGLTILAGPVPGLGFAFSNSARYTFNGTSAQVIGTLFPGTSTTGSLTIDNPAGVTTSANISIQGALNLRAGTLQILPGTAGSFLVLAITSNGGRLAGSTTSNFALVGATSVPTPFPFTEPVTWNGFQMNSGGIDIVLPGNMNLQGNFQLLGGEVTIGDNTLTLNGAVSSTGGVIEGDTTSNLRILAGGAFPANFPAKTNSSFNRLELSRTSFPFVTALTDTLTVDTLLFTAGILTLGSNNLVVTDTANIGDGDAYVRQNSTGRFLYASPSANRRNYPVGTATRWAPVTLDPATPAAFTVTVTDEQPEGAATDYYVNHVWDITPTSGTPLPTEMTLYWNSAAHGGGFLPAERANIYRDLGMGAPWENLKNFFVRPQSLGSGNFSATATNTKGFSRFAVANEFSTLPVELLSFSGKREGTAVSLFWNTASELNNDRFEIERSADGRFERYQTIGLVVGNGTTSLPQEYAFVDHEADPAQTWYYRLRQVDFDDTETRSNAIEIRPDAEYGLLTSLEWRLTPNPSSGSMPSLQALNVPIAAAETVGIQLLSSNGQSVLSQTGPFATVRGAFLQTLRSMPAGTYVVTITYRGTIQTFRHVRY